MRTLEQRLERLDGRGYRAYKDIEGEYRGDGFTLHIDHVQGDPFAAPSRLRALVRWKHTDVPEWARSTPERCRAARDFLVRTFHRAVRQHKDLSIDVGGQTVLERSACLFDNNGSGQGVELRFRADLPAKGRRIQGRQAKKLLCSVLPRALRASLDADADLDLEALRRHCEAVEDQVALRRALDAAGLVAFLGEGSILPRRSGIDDRPLGDGVPLGAPDSLRVTLDAPNAGPLTGLGIPRGVTLIVGGGFHGKSTLLRALELGIYDHVPGDGRERVVSDPSAVKIRAEDGRAVGGVDISPFIGELPGGRSTVTFSTELASGSTSQAAALVEALETGSQTLLIDEDTSATNFMIRDRRMQELVAKSGEPITPLVDRIAELRDRLGVSTVLVMGGSGDYFDAADTVLRMDSYHPRDVTAEAHAVAERWVTGRRPEGMEPLRPPTARTFEPSSLAPERKPGRVKIQARGLDTLVFGRTDVDLRAVEQLVDTSQVRTIGWLLAEASRSDSTLVPSRAFVDALTDLESSHWDALNGHPDGDFALPRLQEVIAALSRMRGVRWR